MNRWDQIQAVARDVASNVHADPVARNTMANDMIKLCAVMIGAVGKGVAVGGEEAMNAHLFGDEEDDGTDQAAFIIGDLIEANARKVCEEASDADLERYSHPVWQHTDRRPGRT